MREHLEPSVKHSSLMESLNGLPLSASGLEGTWSGDKYSIYVLPKVHKGDLKTIFELVLVASTLAIVFIVVHCGFWSRRATVSSSTKRKLAGDGDDGYQHHSIALSACLDEALDEQHEERSFQGTTPARVARSQAETVGFASSGVFREGRKTTSHDIAESSQAELARGETPEASTRELSQGRLEEQATLMTSGPLYSSFRQPGAVQNVECIADRITPSGHTSTSAVLTTFLSHDLTSPYSSGAPTGASGQQESLGLPIQAEREPKEALSGGWEWIQSRGGSTTPGPSQAFVEMRQQLQWDTPSTSNAATGGAEAQSHGSASPQQLPRAAAAASTSGLSAVVAGSPVQASSSSSTLLSGHLFYRLPRCPPFSAPQPLSMLTTRKVGDPRDLARLLNSVRELLVKKELSYAEVQSLADSSGKVLRYVKLHIRDGFKVYWVGALVEQLARRFLILDALLCTCAVTGEAMLDACWWADARPRLLFIPDEWKSRITRGKIRSKYYLALLRGLVTALEQYGQGRRPEAKLVVSLKYKIFFRAPYGSYFDEEEWNPWRRDHILFGKATNALESHSPSSILQAPPAVLKAFPSASSSSPSAQESSRQDASTDDAAYRQHAEYRLPVVQGVEHLRPIDLRRRGMGTNVRVVSVLTTVRDLLLKGSLNSDEAQLLITSAEKLLRIALWRYRDGIKRRKIGDTARALAGRFWVADALWSTSEVLGNRMRKEEWWDDLMKRLSSAQTRPGVKGVQSGERGDAWRFVQRCICALNLYRRHSRPPPSEVVQLKQIILAKNYIEWNSKSSAATTT